jgi:hypothetical protein
VGATRPRGSKAWYCVERDSPALDSRCHRTSQPLGRDASRAAQVGARAGTTEVRRGRIRCTRSDSASRGPVFEASGAPDPVSRGRSRTAGRPRPQSCVTTGQRSTGWGAHCTAPDPIPEPLGGGARTGRRSLSRKRFGNHTAPTDAVPPSPTQGWPRLRPQEPNSSR